MLYTNLSDSTRELIRLHQMSPGPIATTQCHLLHHASNSDPLPHPQIPSAPLAPPSSTSQRHVKIVWSVYYVEVSCCYCCSFEHKLVNYFCDNSIHIRVKLRGGYDIDITIHHQSAPRRRRRRWWSNAGGALQPPRPELRRVAICCAVLSLSLPRTCK